MDGAAFTTSEIETRKRPAYRPLGAFRFGLAILVVLQHLQHLLRPSQRSLFDRMGFGIIAVTIFFAVSGYVVAEADAVFYRGRPMAFLSNRLLRLAPPYYAALALSVALHAALFHTNLLALWDYPGSQTPFTAPRLLGGVFGLLPGLRGLLPDDPFEFIPFAWSLRLEMAFYLAVTATLLAACAGVRRAIPAALVLALAASLGFLALRRPGLLSTAPMFVAGVALYLAQVKPGGGRRLLLAVSVLAASGGFASFGQHGHPVLAAQLGVLAVLAALFAGLTRRRAPEGWGRLDRRLGDLSYPLYLNHYAAGIALTDLTTIRGPVIYCGGLCLSIALAALMASAVDLPLRSLRDRVRGVII